MKAILRLFIGVAALALSLQAKANIILSLEASAQSISLGSPASMDLVISGLGDHASPSLGAFDFDLSYNPAALSAVSVAFGNQLNLGIAGSIQSFDLSTAGVIHLDEVSLESISDLQANQPSSFTLATLGFSSIGPGVSAVGFAFGSLSDEAGVSLQFLTQAGQVEVTGRAVVPDSGSTVSLFALGMVGLFGLRQRQRRWQALQE